MECDLFVPLRRGALIVGLHTDQTGNVLLEYRPFSGRQFAFGVWRVVEYEGDSVCFFGHRREEPDGFAVVDGEPVGQDDLYGSGFQIADELQARERLLSAGMADADLERRACRFAFLGQQPADAYELVAILAVELAGRAVGVNAVGFRGDQNVYFVALPGEVDLSLLVGGEQQRRPVAVQRVVR